VGHNGGHGIAAMGSNKKAVHPLYAGDHLDPETTVLMSQPTAGNCEAPFPALAHHDVALPIPDVGAPDDCDRRQC
jgi:hypothetical protein